MSNVEKRTISIITFWGVPNYGAFAQAYALNETLKKMFPEYTVEHIAYLKKEHYDSYFTKKKPVLSIEGTSKDIIFYKSFYRYIKGWARYLFEKGKDYSLFNEAWNKIGHINIKDENELESKNWDIVITGSDVVWQFSTEMYGVDYHLIGKGLNASELIAYAASCGDQKGKLPDFVIEMVNKYKAISVRDTFSKELVEPLLQTKQTIPIVLDPTLIYNFRNDDNVIYYDNDKYIMVYGKWYKKETVLEIRKYAKENNLKLIGAGYAPDWCDIKIKEMDPFAWIGMFKNAEFVLTNTFHGLMFCLIYNKRFYFYQQPYVKNRSAWILETLGLDKLFLSEDFNLKKMLDYDWNYDRINEIIQRQKEMSLEFIKRAISSRKYESNKVDEYEVSM